MTLFWSLVAIIALAALLLTWQPLWLTRLLLRGLTATLGFRRETTVVDGEIWPWLAGGKADGEPVLFLHGYGADKESWLLYARLFRDGYRLIMPDFPGFGETVRNPHMDFAPRRQAERLAQFCAALELGACHVVGSSMGGYIACWLAIDSPQYVRSLTLLNAAGVFGAEASHVQEQAEQGSNPLLAGTLQDLDRLFALLAHEVPPVPGFVRRYLIALYRRHGALLEKIFWQLVAAQQSDGLEQALPRIAAPTLIVWGEHDQIIDVSCAEVFDREIPVSEILVLPGVGHVPMFEAPRATALAQLGLMKSVLPAQTHAD